MSSIAPIVVVMLMMPGRTVVIALRLGRVVLLWHWGWRRPSIAEVMTRPRVLVRGRVGRVRVTDRGRRGVSRRRGTARWQRWGGIILRTA